MGGGQRRDRFFRVGNNRDGGGRGPGEVMVGREGWREGVNDRLWRQCLCRRGRWRIVLPAARPEQ